MSQFLGAESFLIALGASIQDVQNTFKASLTSYGWQVLHESIPPLAVLGTITTPANAFDLTSSAAGDNSALPRWVGCRMASPFTPTIMYLWGGDNSGQSQAYYNPQTFSLDWSDDGVTWSGGVTGGTLQTWTNEMLWFTGERRKFIVSGATPHAYWRLNITAKGTGTYCLVNQWMLENAAGQVISSQNFIDFIPPSDQAIGDSKAREAVRMQFNGGGISMGPVQELLTGIGQQILVSGATAGAVTVSLTINGVTVSYTGSAPNTTNDNNRGLFDALKASVDANFTDWKWTWVGYIHGQRNTVASNIVPTVANCTLYFPGCSASPQMQYAGIATPEAITIDLINGFVYYLQVNKRGLALGTKTNLGFYGPMHACYGDNATAVAQVPATDYGPNCTVMELVVGYDDVAANTGAVGRFSHYWGDTNTSTYVGGYIDYSVNFCGHAFTRQNHPNIIQDWSNSVAGAGGLNNPWIVLRGEGLFTGADSGVAWAVHRMACDPDTSYPYVNGGGYSARCVGPVFSGLDWYRFVGTLNNEQMVLAPHTDFETKVTGTLLATDLSIPVTSTAGFPASGWISIQGEIIQYTSKDATHFLGCTRGKYATVAYKQYDQTLVSIVGWYVKINTGLIFWGYQKPT
jgi:hypothetical protein